MHLDTTFRGWSSTLAARVRLVISRLVLIFALPLDFHGRVRVVKSLYLPAALHGIEASLLASDSLRKLQSSIHWVVWSRRQPLANVGAVLNLLDGPNGCDPFRTRPTPPSEDYGATKTRRNDEFGITELSKQRFVITVPTNTRVPSPVKVQVRGGRHPPLSTPRLHQGCDGPPQAAASTAVQCVAL